MLRYNYVEYKGAFECVQVEKYSHTSLAYGTKIDGTYGLIEGKNYGTVVYSQRTKTALDCSLLDD